MKHPNEEIIRFDIADAALALQGFYINLVVGAVFAPAYVLLFPSIDPQPGKTLSQKCGMIDWVNTAAFLAGSAILIVAISFAGVVFPFSSGPTIALFTLSGIFLIASVLLIKFHPFVSYENRLYPAHFLKRFILVNMQLQVFLISGIILVSGGRFLPHRACLIDR